MMICRSASSGKIASKTSRTSSPRRAVFSSRTRRTDHDASLFATVSCKGSESIAISPEVDSNASVSFERVLLVEVKDGLAFLGQEPEVPGNLGVMLVGDAIALAPLEELGTRHLEPLDEASLEHFGLGRPVGNEVDNRLACVIRNPEIRYLLGLPSSLFVRTSSAVTSIARWPTRTPTRVTRVTRSTHATLKTQSRTTPAATSATATLVLKTRRMPPDTVDAVDGVWRRLERSRRGRWRRVLVCRRKPVGSAIPARCLVVRRVHVSILPEADVRARSVTAWSGSYARAAMNGAGRSIVLRAAAGQGLALMSGIGITTLRGSTPL